MCVCGCVSVGVWVCECVCGCVSVCIHDMVLCRQIVCTGSHLRGGAGMGGGGAPRDAWLPTWNNCGSRVTYTEPLSELLLPTTSNITWWVVAQCVNIT